MAYSTEPRMSAYFCLLSVVFSMKLKRKRYPSVWTLIVTKVKWLLALMLFVWLVWNIPIKMLAGYYAGMNHPLLSAVMQIVFPNAVYLWFLEALFCCFVMDYIIIKYIKKQGLQFLIVGVMALIGLYFYKYTRQIVPFGNPFKWLIWFWLGHSIDDIRKGWSQILKKYCESETIGIIFETVLFVLLYALSFRVLKDINDIPGVLPEGRTKPWGTGQAVLAAKDVIKTPFIVINADDYYGKEGFKAVHEYLVNGGKSCMAGFVLKNTLSDNGGVTRGICKMDEQNNLTEVVETKNIVKTATGAETEGKVIDVNSPVSMNMWGLTPDFLDVLEEGFKEFFEKEVPGNPLKAEYLIPIFIGELLEHGKMSVKVLKTNDTWYGMTYHEDVAAVKDSFKKMLADGVYKADLFSDL